MNEQKWLTVDEAALLCGQMGLNRTKKTMRNWAKHDHVTARKQTTHHGQMWVLEKSELISKIKAELEFAEQHRAGQAFPETSDPVRNGAEPSGTGRTLPNLSESVRKEAEAVSRGTSEAISGDRVRSLETQIQTLTVDVKWRDQMLDKLTRENERALENLQGQARYIGHLESDLLRRGGKPDQQFLAAPQVEKKDEGSNQPSRSDQSHIIQSNGPHRDQQNLHSG